MSLLQWQWIQRTLRQFRGSQILSTTYLLMASILSMTDPLIVRWIIDRGVHQKRILPLLMALALMLVIFVARIAFLYGGNMISAAVLQRMCFAMRLRLFQKLQFLSPYFHASHPAGDLLARLEQDVEFVGAVAVDLFPALVRIGLTTAVVLCVMITMNWALTCLVVPFVPLFFLLRNYFRSRLEGVANSSRQSIGQRCNFLNEWLAGILQVQLLRAGHVFKRKYGRVAADAILTAMAQKRMEMLYTIATQCVLVLVTIAVLGAGSLSVLKGSLTIGGYIAFYSYLMRLFDPLSAATETYGRVKRAGASIVRIMEIERCSLELIDVNYSVNGDGIRLSREVAFQNVGFGYPGQPRVLEGASFTVLRGMKLALIGRSGSGKSTIAKLLVRFYDPCTGQIRFDATDSAKVPHDEVRAQVSLVPQAPILFAGSIRDNVTLGRPSIGSSELEQFARLACFDTVLDKFPDRWEHLLGPAGAGLSDGERQRLGLLRVLLQERPVLVLDEATSALDPAIEQELLKRLDPYVRDKSVIFISHRLSAAYWADRIILLQNGRIVEEFAPADLDRYGSRLQQRLWGLDLPRELEKATEIIA